MNLWMYVTLRHSLTCFLRACLFVFSEYAEALTNPIKHISQLHKRETQLAVLLEDNNEVRHVCALNKDDECRPKCSPTPIHFLNLSPPCSVSSNCVCVYGLWITQIHLSVAFVQHVPILPKEGETKGECEIIPGLPSSFDALPLCLPDAAPDIIKLPAPGRDIHKRYIRSHKCCLNICT